MDRRGYLRHRTVLSAVGGAMWLALTQVLGAQTLSPAASATATPWVQASAPPTAPTPVKPPHVDKAPAPGPTPSASLSKEDIARAMARKREEELAKQSPMPSVKPPRLMPQLTPEEKEAYERNLTLWLALPPADRQAIRSEAAERIREETEKAYESSGLHLNDDQREVFALRYRQERRRLERELQEKARAERERRLPEIMERIKREFPAPAAVIVVTPRPAATATPSSAK